MRIERTYILIILAARILESGDCNVRVSLARTHRVIHLYLLIAFAEYIYNYVTLSVN